MALPNQLKDNVKNMMSQLSHLAIETIQLNKAKPKTSYRWADTKGVESDHIQIFKNVKTKNSFAFAYFFLDATKTPFIKTNFKIDDEFSETSYSVEGFKDKMKEFNKILKIMNVSKVLTPEALDSAFIHHFIKATPADYEKEVENVVKRINILVKQKSESFKKDLSMDIALKAELDNHKKTMEKLEKKWTKELNIEELQDELNNAKKTLQKKMKIEENKFGYYEKQSQLRDVHSRLRDFNEWKSQEIEAQLKSLPKKHREEAIKKIK